MRVLRWATYAAIAMIVLAWGVAWLRPGLLASLTGQIQSPGAISVGGPFQLTDHTGKAVTEATFRGRFMLIYFGYTFCPDVCPTELQTMSSAIALLGPDAEKIVPIFITVDPERDSVTAVDEYVTLFDKRLVGLTGSAEQISAVARAYRVYYAKATPKDSSLYLMDHSSFLYLMGPDGSFRSLLRQGMSADELAKALRSRLAG